MDLRNFKRMLQELLQIPGVGKAASISLGAVVGLVAVEVHQRSQASGGLHFIERPAQIAYSGACG
jgi:hypothetical protein